MKEPCRLEADEAQLAAVAQRLERRSLEPGDYALLKVVIDTVCFLSRQVRQKATSIQRLLRMIFGARTEKTRAVLNRGVTAEPATQTPGEKPRVKGMVVARPTPTGERGKSRCPIASSRSGKSARPVTKANFMTPGAP